MKAVRQNAAAVCIFMPRDFLSYQISDKYFESYPEHTYASIVRFIEVNHGNINKFGVIGSACDSAPSRINKTIKVFIKEPKGIIMVHFFGYFSYDNSDPLTIILPFGSF